MTLSGNSGLNKHPLSLAAIQLSLAAAKEWKEPLVEPVSRVTRLLLPFNSLSMPSPSIGIDLLQKLAFRQEHAAAPDPT